MATNKLFVGVGSPHGDDQVGWLVADQLLSLGPPGIEIRKAGSPLEILNWLDGVERLVICDACQGSGEIGSVRHWNWPHEELTGRRFSGTHDMGLVSTMELAARLGRLPPTVIVWAVEIGQCAPGDEINAELIRILPDLVQAIRQDT